MPNVDRSLRDEEAAWLVAQMNRTGTSNLDLHAALREMGFDGQENNITMWKTGRTAIPGQWLVAIAKILEGKKADARVVQLYARRMPYLRPYLKKIDEPCEEENALIATQEEKAPKNIYYIAKRGKNKGIRFVLHQNRNGRFQGGVSRFKQDIEEFDSIEALWARIRSDSNFKVRMKPEDNSGPPSLIARDSLVIE